MYNMTREQALEEIEKLTEYVSSLPKNNHPKEYKRGQLYAGMNGVVMTVERIGTPSTELVFLTGARVGTVVGDHLARTARTTVPDDFVYMGDAKDLLSVADNTPRKMELMKEQIEELENYLDAAVEQLGAASYDHIHEAIQSLKTAAG